MRHCVSRYRQAWIALFIAIVRNIPCNKTDFGQTLFRIALSLPFSETYRACFLHQRHTPYLPMQI